MLKKNKNQIILTAAITLLPAFIGLILWNRLPEQIPTHWNFAGEVDGWSSKAFGVFFIPLLMTAIQIFTAVMMCIDPKNTVKKQNIPDKLFSIILWILPVVSIVISAVMYLAALDIPINITLVMGLLLGMLFIIMGNYMPKCRQNYTLGIRLPWTLDNEENWHKTHRLAGKVFVLCGIFLLISSFLNLFKIALGVALFSTLLIPTGYSYFLFTKQQH